VSTLLAADEKRVLVHQRDSSFYISVHVRSPTYLEGIINSKHFS